MALTPAALASAWAYRRELTRDRGVLHLLLVPSLLGGLTGSALLLLTPQSVFDAAVPALLLLATLLLLWQNLKKNQPNQTTSDADPRLPSTEASALPHAGAAARGWHLPARPWLTFLLQLLVGVYGGYFGAGMGIMMLALLSTFAGGADIHRMNAIKVVLGGVINGIAALAFLFAGAVDVGATPIMTAGAFFGSLLGASVARRMNPRSVRWLVVALGLVLTAKLGWERLAGEHDSAFSQRGALRYAARRPGYRCLPVKESSEMSVTRDA